MSISFSSGVYSNFLRSHGLNELEVNLVNVSFFVTIFLFEIPTGVFADVFGRKKSFLVSCLLLSVGEFVYSKANSMFGFITAEVISAIGITFFSGAFQAWFVDRLKHHGHTEKLTKIFVWEGVVRSCACMLASAIGGKLADIAYPLAWLAGSITSLVTALLAVLFMKEEYFEKKSFSIKEALAEIRKTTRDSWYYVHTDRAFRFILMVGFILSFAVMAPNMQWSKIFIDHLHTNYNVSLIMIAIQISVMVGGYASHWFLPLFRGDEKKAIVICQAIIGLTIMLTVLSNNLSSMMTFFLIHELFRGLYRPIKDAYLQDMLPRKERATLSSFESMYGHLGGALGLVVSGWIATTCGIPAAWAVSGSVMIFASLALRNHSKK